MLRGGGSPRRRAASGSAKYHADLSIPGYQPQTPTVAPKPSQAARGPAGDYAGAEADYAEAVQALPAEAQAVTERATRRASRRRAKRAEAHKARRLALPKVSAREKRSQKLKPLPKYEAPKVAVKREKGPKVEAAKAVPAPSLSQDAKPEVFLGKKTAGAPTRRELQRAVKAGKLKTNRKGYVTTPPVRKAVKELRQAKKVAPRASHDVGGIQDPQIRKAIVRHAPKVQELAESQYGLSGEALLSKLIEGESAEDQGAVSTASAKSITQFIPSTREDFVTRLGVDPWKNKNSAVKAATMHLDGKHGYTAGLEGYNPGGGQDYVNYILSQASGTPVKTRSPEGTARLRKAQEKAAALGLKVGKPAGDLSQGKGKTVQVRADAKGMVDWAESALGTDEGTAKQLRWAGKYGLGGTEPWCANFISNGLARRGIKNLPSNPNYVPSYESEWAKYAVPGGLAKAKPGDVLTFSGRHIGLYVGNGEMVSGNSSDSVNRTPVESDLSMVIRPPYKGGTVEIQESAALPGSVSVTSGSSAAPAGVGLVAPPSVAGSRAAKKKRQGPRLSTAQKIAQTNKALNEVGVRGVGRGSRGSRGGSELDRLEEKYLGAAA